MKGKKGDFIDRDCIFVLFICSLHSSEFVLQDVRHCLEGFSLNVREHLYCSLSPTIRLRSSAQGQDT